MILDYITFPFSVIEVVNTNIFVALSAALTNDSVSY